jgi:hypothetical protein
LTACAGCPFFTGLGRAWAEERGSLNREPTLAKCICDGLLRAKGEISSVSLPVAILPLLRRKIRERSGWEVEDIVVLVVRERCCSEIPRAKVVHNQQIRKIQLDDGELENR